MQEISVNEIKGIKIGQTEDVKGATGCTVFISEDGMRAGLDVRGGGPASRESQLLNPLMSAETIHAVILGGQFIRTSCIGRSNEIPGGAGYWF